MCGASIRMQTYTRIFKPIKRLFNDVCNSSKQIKGLKTIKIQVTALSRIYSDGCYGDDDVNSEVYAIAKPLPPPCAEKRVEFNGGRIF